MMDEAKLAYLEKNCDEANPSYWSPKLIAEIRRLREDSCRTDSEVMAGKR